MALLDQNKNKPPLEVRIVENFKKDDLTCAICLGILHTPRQCRNGHLFCEECIQRSIQKNPTCPSCRCNLSESDLSRSLFVEKHLRSMMVYCIYHFQWDEAEKIWVVDDKGCKDTFEYQEVVKHEQQCGFVHCTCPFSKLCGKLRKKDLEEHKKKCDFRPVECQYCRIDIQALKLKEHHDVCSHVPVSCHLCQQQVLRKEVMLHMQRDCPENLVTCPYGCKDKVLRKFFKKHSQESVEEHLEMMRLSHQKSLQTLEATLQAEVKNREKQITYLRKKLAHGVKTIWSTDGWGTCLDRGYVQSQKFSLGGCEWYVGLYPDGEGEADRGNVSIYLFFSSGNLNEKSRKLALYFKISFINKNSSVAPMSFNFTAIFPVANGSGWGAKNAFKNNILTKDSGFLHNEDRLLIETDIIIKQEILHI